MSRARFAIAACVAVVAVAVAAAPASAATTASQTVKFTNQAAVQLTLTPASIDLGTVDPLGTATSATPPSRPCSPTLPGTSRSRAPAISPLVRP